MNKPFEPIRIATITKHSLRIEPPGYRFFDAPKNAGKIKKWLARKMWKVLGKWKFLDQYYTFERTYTYGHQEITDVTKALFKVLDDIIYTGDKVEDFALVMGSAEFMELTRIGILNNRTFPIERIAYGSVKEDTGERYVAEIHGLKVHVVSTVSGIHAIPKVFIEKTENTKTSVRKVVRVDTLSDPRRSPMYDPISNIMTGPKG